MSNKQKSNQCIVVVLRVYVVILYMCRFQCVEKDVLILKKSMPNSKFDG